MTYYAYCCIILHCIVLCCIVQIRGVLSIQGCFERTVFVWKSPNILDYHGDGEMATKFDFPSIASCVQQGEAEFLKYQNCSASATDIRTMENVCSRFHFNAVRFPGWLMYVIKHNTSEKKVFILLRDCVVAMGCDSDDAWMGLC